MHANSFTRWRHSSTPCPEKKRETIFHYRASQKKSSSLRLVVNFWKIAWNFNTKFHIFILRFIARSSYASAVLGIVIMSVCPSVRPSVTRVLCDETKEYTANILIPHERVINLVFWHQQGLVGDVPFHLKFALKMTHSLWKTPTSINICL